VIWEAQYGDFINGAQVMIDEFLVSARDKWGQTPSLVLLLPHGSEGQGPDHSTGRPEMFLQWAAHMNIRVANPTTAGQYFHLLRRQAALLEVDPLPLIVLTPKSLLRHPRAFSSLQELAEGGWRPVLDDPALPAEGRGAVRRLILCTGRVYVDLADRRENSPQPAVALARLEQLYTFPEAEVAELLAGYPALEELVWLQEEPANLGAWGFVRGCLEELSAGRWPVRYLGRPRRSTPAEGSLAWYKRIQGALVAQALE
jgi:2-oxoglutarate dehydrogenase E1 component